ncbi:MAG: hydrolase, HAD-superfamily, subfamily [Candidatus Eremiobacteraeota bacterium]|jgi:histidinol-phosphate phosphatase family protein|nr:hydrolase, HAD-superfamily, subfamily [Candidatus Eremiobacteraeota bacterium]
MVDLVVPTIGRPSLRRLLNSIGRSSGPRPGRIFVVDDRRDRSVPLELGLNADLGRRVTVCAGRAAGPASARNIGWRCSRAAWVAFVDDDVLVPETWLDDLARDLRDLPGDVAGSQGRVRVPLPKARKPTDWERNVAGLATSRWITADCAYRRIALLAAGGFDERFRRAYREDADLALRVVAGGQRIVRGERCVTHPVGAADWTISVRLQAGNADDALMDALHGRAWRSRAGAARGAYRQHVAAVSAAGIALGACAAHKPKVAAFAAAAWALLAGYFAWRRIAPGPRTRGEIAAMLATSVAIPFAAVYHRARGAARRRAALADHARAPKPIPRAVLFDRDGTLVVDLPFNRDPDRVEPMPGAAAALAMLRAAGVPTAVVSNQNGVALGRVTRDDVDALNARIDGLLGPLGPVFVCTHLPGEGCRCRKPAPGLLEAAARQLGVRLRDCVVVGDIGADIEAARAAGARAILVPTAVTRAEEIAAAPVVARDLEHAVRLILGEEA